MAASRASLLLMAASCILLSASQARAQAHWWSHAPVDFEECADAADNAATREAKTAALSECNAKFAGRRKPGGGYTYYDFMQNRSFDIAGPNPTPEEQRRIDEQYTEFLERERRNSIAAAFAAKQQQLQQATFRSETEKVPQPAVAPKKPPAAAPDLRSRARSSGCPRHSFSCEWPRLSEGINDLKKLFGLAPGKDRRG